MLDLNADLVFVGGSIAPLSPEKSEVAGILKCVDVGSGVEEDPFRLPNNDLSVLENGR